MFIISSFRQIIFFLAICFSARSFFCSRFKFILSASDRNELFLVAFFNAFNATLEIVAKRTNENETTFAFIAMF